MHVSQLLLAVFVATLFACSDPQTESIELVQTAKQYISNNKTREAALELKNSLKANPKNAEARFMLADLYLEIGDAEGAIKEFNKSLSAGWSKADVMQGLGKAYLLSGNYKKLLEKVKIDADFTDADKAELYGMRAAAYLGTGDLSAALKAVDAGDALDADAYYLLKTHMQISMISKNITEAGAMLERALSKYPDARELMILQAQYAIQNKDSDTAKQVLNEVVQREPKNMVTIYGRIARLKLTRIYITEGEVELAEKNLKPLLKFYPENPEVNYLGAMLSFRQGDLDTADLRIQKAVNTVPDNAQIQLLYGTISFARKHYEQTVLYLSKYLNTYPGNIGVRKLLGRTYMLLGQDDQAETALLKDVPVETSDAELLALGGLSQLRMGDSEAGIAGLREAIRLEPDNTAYHGELAKAYISTGEAGLAIDELTKLVAAGNESEQIKNLLILAYLRNKQYDKAIAAAKETLARKPDDVDATIMVANVLAVSKKTTEARQYFDKALQLDPDSMQAIMSLARLEIYEGNLGAARQLYVKATTLADDSIEAELSLARMAEKEPDENAMQKWLEQARAKAPDNITPRLMLIEYYLRKHQNNKAAEVLKEAEALDKENFSVILQRGKLQLATKKYSEALSTLTNLVIDVPDSYYARTILGEIHLKMGQLESAEKEFLAALKSRPDHLPAMALLSNVYLQKGDIENASQYASKVRQQEPELYVGYELTGDTQVASDNVNDAYNSYKKAWSINQTSVLAVKLSRVLIGRGDPDAAVSLLRGWVSKHEDDMTALQLLGTTLQEKGDNDGAERVYSQLLKLQPENIYALNNMAWLLSLKADPSAIDYASRAYKLSPESSGIQDTYGWVLLQQGDAEKAVTVLKRAYDKLPGIPEVGYHYAAALIKAGKGQQGQAILSSVLAAHDSFTGREDAEKLLKK